MASRRLRALLLLSLLAVLCMLGCTVEDTSGSHDDLVLAEKAAKERDIGDAEMYYKRYLRKNTEGLKRWEVWQKLLEIALTVRQDKETASEYLEIMFIEFEADPPKRRSIQINLAGLYSETHAYNRAVKLWEALAADPETGPEDLAVVYRELSRAYLRRLEFTEATDVLGLCLQLAVGPETKADCLYSLAETQLLTEELGASEKALRDLLALEGVSADRRVAAVFMLADVVEQLDRLDEAETLLESIHDSYPNAKVLEIRLSALRDKKKNKQDTALPVKR